MKSCSLKTERLILEKLNQSHGKSLFDVLNDSAVYSYIPQNVPRSVAELEQRYAKLEDNLLAPDKEVWLNYAVRLEQPSEYIGRVEATVKKAEADKETEAEIAYLFGSRYWGFGYASEAVQELIACLKKEYDVTVVRATSDTRNASSIKLLERLGFQCVARVDAAGYFKGQTSNEYVYELRFTSTAYAT